MMRVRVCFRTLKFISENRFVTVMQFQVVFTCAGVDDVSPQHRRRRIYTHTHTHDSHVSMGSYYVKWQLTDNIEFKCEKC